MTLHYCSEPTLETQSSTGRCCQQFVHVCHSFDAGQFLSGGGGGAWSMVYPFRWGGLTPKDADGGCPLSAEATSRRPPTELSPVWERGCPSSESGICWSHSCDCEGWSAAAPVSRL